MGMLTLLAACNGPAEIEVGGIDRDGDGFVAGDDCDDTRGAVHPGAREVAGDGTDQDCDGIDPLREGTIVGAEANEGFGTRVLVAGGEVVVAAPFTGGAAGRVQRGLVGAEAASLPGATGAFFGAGLAATSDGTVLVGAPGLGRVTTLHGAVLVEEAGAGGVIAAREARWAASTADGFVTEAGSEVLGARPDALALDATGVWAGFARGATAARRGAVSIARAATGDEAGYALLVGDVDQDGDEDLVVGAPGAGVIYVIDPAAPPASLTGVTPIGPGTGRFGAALALGEEGRLYVGAPMAGDEVEGAVYVVRAGVVSELATGEAPGDQLGAALAFGQGTLVLGAPGAADAAGSVRVLAP